MNIRLFRRLISEMADKVLREIHDYKQMRIAEDKKLAELPMYREGLNVEGDRVLNLDWIKGHQRVQCLVGHITARQEFHAQLVMLLNDIGE